MDNIEEIKLLTEMKETEKQILATMNDIKIVLQNDRIMMWKILALTIIGAFAIIGVKLAFP